MRVPNKQHTGSELKPWECSVQRQATNGDGSESEAVSWTTAGVDVWTGVGRDCGMRSALSPRMKRPGRISELPTWTKCGEGSLLPANEPLDCLPGSRVVTGHRREVGSDGTDDVKRTAGPILSLWGLVENRNSRFDNQRNQWTKQPRLGAVAWPTESWCVPATHRRTGHVEGLERKPHGCKRCTRAWRSLWSHPGLLKNCVGSLDKLLRAEERVDQTLQMKTVVEARQLEPVCGHTSTESHCDDHSTPQLRHSRTHTGCTCAPQQPKRPPNPQTERSTMGDIVAHHVELRVVADAKTQQDRLRETRCARGTAQNRLTRPAEKHNLRCLEP